MVVVPAVEPEEKANEDRQREMHEVEKRRHHVLHTDHARVIEVVLQRQRWQRAPEDGAFDA